MTLLQSSLARSTVVADGKRGTVKMKMPPGRKTLLISLNPARSSGTCSKTSVEVQISKLSFAKVSCCTSWQRILSWYSPGVTSSKYSEQVSLAQFLSRNVISGPRDESSYTSFVERAGTCWRRTETRDMVTAVARQIRQRTAISLLWSLTIMRLVLQTGQKS